MGVSKFVILYRILFAGHFCSFRRICSKQISCTVGDSNSNLPTNKFNQLKLISKNKDGMLVITETKLDSSLIQFIMDGLWQPYHLDKNSNDRGVIIFAKEANSSKSMSQHTFLDSKEGMCIDINLTKTRWLLLGSFYP